MILIHVLVLSQASKLWSLESDQARIWRNLKCYQIPYLAMSKIRFSFIFSCFRYFELLITVLIFKKRNIAESLTKLVIFLVSILAWSDSKDQSFNPGDMTSTCIKIYFTLNQLLRRSESYLDNSCSQHWLILLSFFNRFSFLLTQIFLPASKQRFQMCIHFSEIF